LTKTGKVWYNRNVAYNDTGIAIGGIMKRVTNPRSERIWVNVTPEVKERLNEIANERRWSTSLLCYAILQAWLEGKSLARAEGASHAGEI
jgi:hypothetical protein